MWNKPHLLNAIADLLMLVAGAAVLAAAAVWLVRVPSLPVRRISSASAAASGTTARQSAADARPATSHR